MAQAQIDGLQKHLDLYRLDTGQYPSTEQGLKALVERPANESKWGGPYLKKGVPMDPWGRAYLYRYPGEKSELDLVSLGKDGHRRLGRGRGHHQSLGPALTHTMRFELKALKGRQGLEALQLDARDADDAIRQAAAQGYTVLSARRGFSLRTLLPKS